MEDLPLTDLDPLGPLTVPGKWFPPLLSWALLQGRPFQSRHQPSLRMEPRDAWSSGQDVQAMASPDAQRQQPQQHISPDGRPITQAVRIPVQAVAAPAHISPVHLTPVQQAAYATPAAAPRYFASRAGGVMLPNTINVQPLHPPPAAQLAWEYHETPAWAAAATTTTTTTPSLVLPAQLAAAAGAASSPEPTLSPSPIPIRTGNERVRVRRSSLPSNVPAASSQVPANAVHPLTSRSQRSAQAWAGSTEQLPMFSPQSQAGSVARHHYEPARSASQVAPLPHAVQQIHVAPPGTLQRPQFMPSLADYQAFHRQHSTATAAQADDSVFFDGNLSAADAHNLSQGYPPARPLSARMRAWSSNDATRAAHEAAGTRPPSRIEVRAGGADMSTHSVLSTAREALPTYSEDGSALSMQLTKLEYSTGVLVPRFNPDIKFYTLFVGTETKFVMLYPEPIEGEVLVNEGSAGRPIELHDVRKNVLISVHSKLADFAPVGYYNVEIVCEDPPPEPPARDARVHDFRVAIHDFRTSDPNKIPLVVGDYVLVIDETPNGWLLGKKCSTQGIAYGPQGYFPPGFVQPAELPRAQPVLVEPAAPPAQPPARVAANLGMSLDAAEAMGVGLPHRAATSGVSAAPPKEHLVAVTSDNIPIFTIILSLVCVIMLIIALSRGGGFKPSINPLLGPDHDALKSLGARWVPSIREGNANILLLITELFLPAGAIKCLIDIGLFWTALRAIERRCGTARACIVFLLSGVIGNLTGATFVPHWLNAGSGSGAFGCAGALLALWQFGTRPGTAAALLATWECVLMLVLMVISMLLGLLPGVENWSQVGGLFAGYCVSLLVNGQVFAQCGRHKVVVKRLFLTGALAVGLLLASNIANFVFLSSLDSPCEWCMQATCLPVRDYCEIARLGRM
jgi:membrane associated rhomboid family serine protease